MWGTASTRVSASQSPVATDRAPAAFIDRAASFAAWARVLPVGLAAGQVADGPAELLVGTGVRHIPSLPRQGAVPRARDYRGPSASCSFPCWRWPPSSCPRRPAGRRPGGGDRRRGGGQRPDRPRRGRLHPPGHRPGGRGAERGARHPARLARACCSSRSDFARLAERVRVSPVPVAVWVGPTGATASAATAAILAAAGIAGMAPGTKVAGLGPDEARCRGLVATIDPTLGEFVVGLDGEDVGRQGPAHGPGRARGRARSAASRPGRCASPSWA